MVRHILEGFIKKKSKYRGKCEFDFPGSRILLHVRLPPFHVPDENSYKPDKKPSTKITNNRISLTWRATHEIEQEFSFFKDEKKMQEYRPESYIECKFGEGFKKNTTKAGEVLKDSAENIIAKWLAELSSP